MDLKRNERFFKQNDVVRLVGGGLLIVGLLWFWLGWSAASYYGPCVMVPVGLVMFLVASARHVPESEIRGNIQKALSDLGADITESPDFSTRVLTIPAPYRGESFVFDERASVCRRGKDAKLLTDVYSATAIYFTRDALLLRGRTVKLSDGTVSDDTHKLLWENISGATLIPFETRMSLTNKRNASATARGAVLTVLGVDGQAVYSASVPNDMDGETLCEHIAKRCAAKN